ncbi:hypothetical protein M413DRAFT_79504 [Hebeloma cylindrosporum]|uniref:SET domain-containing protein n=1 Tax=Hebeloma cylindrosporum TaxID=76867 RepID=A0A0C3BEY2_HEBCY|nr:hypothetical protein M413DRAFT_79504 [Hebeloma cylindrosporum h7]
MPPSTKVGILLEWCDANSISIDSTIRVEDHEQGGFGVFSANKFIPPNTTLVRIPKTSILSVRTCSLAGVVPFNPYGLGAQLSASLALLGNKSRWHGYIQSLPTTIVDLPIFWGLNMEGYDHDDGLEAICWLNGTEAGKILQQKNRNGNTTLVSYEHESPAKKETYTQCLSGRNLSFLL